MHQNPDNPGTDFMSSCWGLTALLMVLILFVEGKLCTNFALPGSKKRDQKQQRTDAFSGDGAVHVGLNRFNRRKVVIVVVLF